MSVLSLKHSMHLDHLHLADSLKRYMHLDHFHLADSMKRYMHLDLLHLADLDSILDIVFLVFLGLVLVLFFMFLHFESSMDPLVTCLGGL